MAAGFDVESMRHEHESSAEWALRRAFLNRFHDRFPHNRLLCLASCFINVECYRCAYPSEVMKTLAGLMTEMQEELDRIRKRAKGEHLRNLQAVTNFIKGGTVTQTIELPDEDRGQSGKQEEAVLNRMKGPGAPGVNIEKESEEGNEPSEFKSVPPGPRKCKVQPEAPGSSCPDPITRRVPVPFVKSESAYSSTDVSFEQQKRNKVKELMSEMFIKEGELEEQEKKVSEEHKKLLTHTLPKIKRLAIVVQKNEALPTLSNKIMVLNQSCQKLRMGHLLDFQLKSLNPMGPFRCYVTFDGVLLGDAPGLNKKDAKRLGFEQAVKNLHMTDMDIKFIDTAYALRGTEWEEWNNVKVQKPTKLQPVKRESGEEVPILGTAQPVNNTDASQTLGPFKRPIGPYDVKKEKVDSGYDNAASSSEPPNKNPRLFARSRSFSACRETRADDSPRIPYENSPRITPYNPKTKVYDYDHHTMEQCDKGMSQMPLWHKLRELKEASYNTQHDDDESTVWDDESVVGDDFDGHSTDKRQTEYEDCMRDTDMRRHGSLPPSSRSQSLPGNSSYSRDRHMSLPPSLKSKVVAKPLSDSSAKSKKINKDGEQRDSTVSLADILIIENQQHTAEVDTSNEDSNPVFPTALAILTNTASFNHVQFDFDFRTEDLMGMPSFRCDVKYGIVLMGSATALTQKSAKNAAAQKALDYLRNRSHTIVTKQTADASGSTVDRADLGTNGEPSLNREAMISSIVSAIPESNKGNKLLRKMGWSGGGVGVKGQGIANPVGTGITTINREGLGLADSKGISKDFIPKVRKIVRDYVNSDDEKDLVFASGFTKEERALVHREAQKLGLKSHSHGKGEKRYLILSRKRSANSLYQYIAEQGGETAKYKIIGPKK